MPTESSNQCRHVDIDWNEVVEQIKTNHPAGAEKLYAYFRGVPRYGIAGKLDNKSYTEDVLHETYQITLAAIRKGEIKNPQALPGFIRTTGLRIVYDTNKPVGNRDSVDLEDIQPPRDTRITPEQELLQRQQQSIFMHALRKLKPKYQEILTRAYLKEQSPKQIQEAMGLTEKQLWDAKNEAKGQLIETARSLEKSHLSRLNEQARSPTVRTRG